VKRKKVWIPLVVLAIIIVIGIVLFIKGRTANVHMDMPEELHVMVQKVKEEILDETILVTGKIVPEDEQKIYVEPEQGEIVEFKVEENSKVKAGDPLFVYDGTSLENEYNAAVRNHNLIQNGIESEQNQIAQINNQIEQMKKDMDQFNKLREEQKKQKAAYEAAKKEAEKEQKENPEGEEEQQPIIEEPYFEDIPVITKEDIRQLELERDALQLQLENTKAEVATAQDAIDELEKQKEDLTVKSKIDGTVVKVNKNLERTEEGVTEPIVHIISSEPFKVIGTMSEFDAVKIKPKQKVSILPKVYKDREWKGEVESVSQFPNDDSSVGTDYDMMYDGGDGSLTMYPFKVAITDDTKDLRQGFHVSLEVSIGGDEKKLVVPHSAMMDEMMMMEDEDYSIMDDMFGTSSYDEMDDSSFVYVLVDGVLERRDVEVGNMSDEYVEILDGVSLGELVVISPFFEMYDGMEVESYDEVE